MKKGYIGIALALVLAATPVLAQPTVGVYYDTAGTISNMTIGAAIQPVVFDAYVIVFWENMIGGASYGISFDPAITPIGEVYPEDAINIGSPFDGCGTEVGFGTPQFGFYNTPVLVTTLQFFVPQGTVLETPICVVPHCNYPYVVVADRYAELFEAEGFCALVVDNDSESWGAVKNMYK